MTDLTVAFNAQQALQITSYGADPYELEGEDRTEYIMWNVLAATDELHELLNEVGWKPWATSRHVNEEAAKGELVDVFHFFMNLSMALHMGPEELMQKYIEKRQINARRQEEGYDGVDGKCPKCKRALDDPAVQCQKVEIRGDDKFIEERWLCTAREES